MIKCFLTLQQIREYLRLLFQITKIPFKVQIIYPSLKKKHLLLSFPDIPEIKLLKLPEDIENKIYSLFNSTDTDISMTETPMMYTEQEVYTFFCIPYKLIRSVKRTDINLLLTVGPAFQKQMNKGFSGPELCWKNRKHGCFRGCTDEQIHDVSPHLPYWNIPHLCAVVQLLYVVLFNTWLPISDILTPATIRDIDVDTLTAELLFQKREKYTFHTPFTQELKLWKIIQNGEVDKIPEALIILTFLNHGKVASTRQRQEKNIAICTVALATRCALMGGVPDDIAYTMSDSFIQKIEELSTTEASIQFNKIIISEFTKKVATYKHAHTQKYSPVVKECVQYIEQHLHEKIMLEDLADELNLSISQISRKFKKETGVSFVDYYQKEKITTACDMLLYSERSLLEISTILAFSSQSYFSAIFKKYTGHTPAEYRSDNHPMQKQISTLQGFH